MNSEYLTRCRAFSLDKGKLAQENCKKKVNKLDN